MKMNQDLIVVPIPMPFGGNTHEINLSLIVDEERRAALVDAGMPGSADEILARLHELGYEPSDVKMILVTHHDIDHVGSLADLKEKTGAEIYASSGEQPYIEGDIPFVKANPERLAQMPFLAELLKKYRPVKVDRVLEFGDFIPFAGGIKVIGTPGHTPGHTSYYLERSKALVAGDALTASSGKLNGPSEGATPDMVAARKSVQDLVPLEIDSIVTYHGGLVDENAQGQLQSIAG